MNIIIFDQEEVVFQRAFMIQSVEAIIDPTGKVQLLDPIQLNGSHRALVMILEESTHAIPETALLSEVALADWLNPQEDAAWAYLQQGK